MRFLVDNAVSPVVVLRLIEAGHDATHVRELGLADANDERVFDRAAAEQRILISADTDFGAILAVRETTSPSLILFRGSIARSPDAQARLLLSVLQTVAADLDRGAVVVLDEARVRIRALPI